MRGRKPSIVGAVLIAAVAAALMSASLAGQTRPAAKAAASSALPRTPDGHVDLQGTYDIATLTPVERPRSANGKLTLTDKEAAAIEGAESKRVFERALPSPVDRAAPPVGAPVGGYNNFWIDRGSTVIRVDNTPRSSLIIDPADGKIPELTAEAKARIRQTFRNGPNADANEENQQGFRLDPEAYNDPEQRPLGERCLLGFGSTSGPPTMPNYFYNNLKQIVQTPIDDPDSRRDGSRRADHPDESTASAVRASASGWAIRWATGKATRWSSTPRTSPSKTRFRGSTDQLHVVERFWRTDSKTLMYRFTVEDPQTWTKPWTGEFPWPATDQPMYEYACHEGNYALADILRGARAAEERGEGAKK